jgi:glycosyltransferase involved in cell wall biosynthesis
VRVVWTGTFEPEFSRNRKLARLLHLGGFDTTLVRESLWPPDRVGLASRAWLPVMARALWVFPKLMVRLLVGPTPDIYLVSYPGWFDVPLVWLVSRLKRRRIVFDPFISLYDTLVSDRSLRSDDSLTARVAHLADRWSLRLADVVLADTAPHLAFYDALAPGVSQRGHVLPVGADDAVFRPEEVAGPESKRVLFYGSFVPLQGLATIVQAATLLEGEGVRFLIIGDGQDRPALEEEITRTGVDIDLIGLVPLDELPAHISRAEVCLGIFGESDKAGRVVPHKLYECLAMGRPVVTRDGPGIRSLFGGSEVKRVTPADPQALAEAIRSLIEDPERRRRLAEAGHAAYRERFHEEPLVELLVEVFQSALD